MGLVRHLFAYSCGLVKADSGKIFLDDDDISNISIDSRSKWGLLFHQNHLFLEN